MQGMAQTKMTNVHQIQQVRPSVTMVATRVQLLANDSQNIDSAVCCSSLKICYGHIACAAGWWLGPSAAFSWVLEALHGDAWVSSKKLRICLLTVL